MLIEQVDTARYLPVPPSICKDSLDQQDWAVTSTFRIGEWDLGVRSNTFELDEMVRKLLRAHHRPELTDAPANISLQAGEIPREDGTRDLHILYRECSIFAREREVPDLLRRLVDQLESYAYFDRNDMLVLGGVVLLTEDGRALLGPELVRRQLLIQQPLLARQGLRLLNAGAQLLDEQTGELVFEPPVVDADHALIDASTIPAWPRGRVPIAGWMFFGADAPGTMLSPGTAVINAVTQVGNRPLVGPQRALDGVARALEGARYCTVVNDWPTLSETLTTLSGQR